MWYLFLAMKITEEKIKEKLQEAAGEQPVVACGYGYTGPSTYVVGTIALVVFLLGAAIGIFTFGLWWIVPGSAALGGAAYYGLRRRVTFCLVGVTPKHFIVIDHHRGRFLPPALQGLSAIQYPKTIDKELSTILHYVLGDGTIHDVRFQDFRGLPDNRRAAYRIKQAVHENVYREPSWGVGREGEVIR
ncbi:MAG: hypothetical protein V3U28_09845 [Candidatus Acidoferrales bacterium]